MRHFRNGKKMYNYYLNAHTVHNIILRIVTAIIYMNINLLYIAGVAKRLIAIDWSISDDFLVDSSW